MKYGSYESIMVYPDALRPGEWCCDVRHRNGGNLHSGLPTQQEAWEKARSIVEWHRQHPFHPDTPRES